MRIEYHLLAQSGTSGTTWAGMSLAEKSRYADGSGGYNVWSGIGLWLSNYMVVLANYDLTKDIVLEVVDAFVDTTYTNMWGYLKYFKSVTITCIVNGTHSNAFHGGIRGGGYINRINNRSLPDMSNVPNSHIYGLEFEHTAAGRGLKVGAVGSIINCFSKIYGGSAYTAIRIPTFGRCLGNNGVNTNGAAFYGDTYSGALVAYNLAHSSAVGFRSPLYTDARALNDSYVGNLAFDNTINWEPHTCTTLHATRFSALYNMGDDSDLVDVGFSDDGGLLSVTLAAHGINANAPVRFINGGLATAPTGISFGTKYYVKTVSVDSFTISTTPAGTAIPYADSGSGTIQYSYVWDTRGLIAGHVNSDGSDFSNATNGDFSPASSASPQVNVLNINSWDGLPLYDMAAAVRPNYEDGNDLADCGPLEYNHGNGLAPQAVTIKITAINTTGTPIANARVRLLKTSDSTVVLEGLTDSSGILQDTAYTYTADTDVTGWVRKSTSAPRYKQGAISGTITENGLTATIVMVSDE